MSSASTTCYGQSIEPIEAATLPTGRGRLIDAPGEQPGGLHAAKGRLEHLAAPVSATNHVIALDSAARLCEAPSHA